LCMMRKHKREPSGSLISLRLRSVSFGLRYKIKEIYTQYIIYRVGKR
jgi:hypothetical protein